MRTVTISLNPQPEGFEYELSQIWIQAKEDNVAEYIKSGIKMMPDELRIEKELFGLFAVK